MFDSVDDFEDTGNQLEVVHEENSEVLIEKSDDALQMKMDFFQ